MSPEQVTEEDLVDEVARSLARARFGAGLDMGGAHNPRPSEYRRARELVDLVLDFATRPADG